MIIPEEILQIASHKNPNGIIRLAQHLKLHVENKNPQEIANLIYLCLKKQSPHNIYDLFPW